MKKESGKGGGTSQTTWKGEEPREMWGKEKLKGKETRRYKKTQNGVAGNKKKNCQGNLKVSKEKVAQEKGKKDAWSKEITKSPNDPRGQPTTVEKSRGSENRNTPRQKQDSHKTKGAPRRKGGKARGEKEQRGNQLCWQT